MKRILTSLALAASLAIVAAPATAQQKSETIQKAEAHFRKGAEYYAAGEYAKAVVEFKFGHTLAPNAMFLYNMSLAYERLDSYEEAAQAATQADQMGGMPDEIAQRNRARMVAFRRIVAAGEAAEDFERLNAAVVENEVEEPEETARLVETRSDGVNTVGFIGLGLTAVGGGLALAGLMTNQSLDEDIATYESAAASGDRATYDTTRETIVGKQQRGKVFYAAGAGLAGIGLFLFVADAFIGTEEVVVGYLPAPGGGTVSAAFQF